MENFMGNVLVQGLTATDNFWGYACSYWNWSFWIGFLAGVIGALVSFFLKRPEHF
ncbi:MAG TPA: hypothetical protein VK463_11580 [Desulfomonilaceae bacterium]|nr:hypothetical protein [Desulfomonilaceae bacterium]